MTSIGSTFETKRVDLDGVAYQTIPRTRSVTLAAAKLAETEGSILDNENANPDDQVAYLAKAVALRLRPVEDGLPTANERLVDLWQTDKLTLDGLFGLIEELSGSAEGNSNA